MPSHARNLLILLALCLVCFWFRLGRIGLIDPDEPFYAQTAHEMVVTGDWMTPQIYGGPQFEKPIFYYWLVAASFKTLGENEFTGRLPATLFATLLVLLVYAFSARVYSKRTGLLAAVVLATGLEFMLMSRLMLTDIPLAFFLSGSVFSAWLAYTEPEKRDRWMFLHLLSMGMAWLTKGPIGILFPCFTMAAYFIFQKPRQWAYRGKGVWLGLAAALIVGVPWYAYTFAHHGVDFWKEFFVRDNYLRWFHSEHPSNNHFWYYPGLLILGSIPWMPLVLLTIKRAITGLRENEPAFFQWCWLLSNLVFLSFAASKLPSYAFFLFVPLAVIGGRHLDELLERGFRGKGERNLVLGAALLQGLVPLATPFIKAAQPFVVPAYLLGGLLVVAMICLARRAFPAWVISTAAGSTALLVASLTLDVQNAENLSSTKPTALRLLQIQAQHPGEPLIAGKFPVRGIIYYTQQAAERAEQGKPGGKTDFIPSVMVLASEAQPFWAAHPTLKIIIGKGGLKDFLATHPSALCVMRKSDWDSTYDTSAVFQKQDSLEQIGDNIIVRALPRTSN